VKNTHVAENPRSKIVPLAKLLIPQVKNMHVDDLVAGVE
jgi:hypothetical protein